MANSDNVKMFRYYEGLCSSDDFPKELAKVLSLGVQSDATTDSDGIVISEPQPLKDKNWDIIFPSPDSSFTEDVSDMSPETYKAKILNQVNKITDTVILKTRTTEKDESNSTESDEFSVDADTNVAYREMYLEIYRPEYIANPEEYPLDCERKGLIPKSITTELYEKQFLDHIAIEETLNDTFDSTRVTTRVTKEEQTAEGTSVDVSNLTYDECDEYYVELQSVTGDLTLRMPNGSILGDEVSKTIDSAILSKIKQESYILYSFITSSFTGQDSYNQFQSLTITFSTISTDDTGLFQITMKPTIKTVNYTIKKGTVFTLAYTPIETVYPELYLDGIYIPIEKKYYTTSTVAGTGKTIITFKENFNYEKSNDGILVVRYEYKVDTSDNLITERVAIKNNHYLLLRLFDNINEEGNGPAENIYDNSGEVITTNSHVSPWSKLSWYQDFEEKLLDTLDSDSPVNDITDGTVFVPLETTGLSGDTKLQYWINTNNDRFSLIVMGNPSLDLTRDRHLISSCYCGAIDSFDNSILDVSGNFALYTSSSTEPCKTTLTTEKTYTSIVDYILDDDSYLDTTTSDTDYSNFLNSVPYKASATGEQLYYIQLTDENQYFSTDVWPKYMFVDSNNNPVTPLRRAFRRQFVLESGKSNLLQLWVNSSDINFDGNMGYKILVNFGYYTEKFILTSGVTRDSFGNVLDVAKEDTYGKNTSDGTTSITMFHSRSKAYYQKHQMLFATTEEYMSKVLYGKSKYTGEYYADRIKVTHGTDGPRGILSDLLVIDNSSLYPMDELVINKDFEKEADENEETFVYFPVTAPYSPLSDGPNARYGLAIKKSEKEPAYSDEKSLVAKVIKYLLTISKNSWNPTEIDIYPLDTTDIAVDSNGGKCKIYWKTVPNTSYELNSAGTKVYYNNGYEPLRLIVTMTSDLRGDLDGDTVTPATLTVTSGTTDYDMTNNLSYIKASGITLDTGEVIGYGIADETDEVITATELGEGAQLKSVVYDGDLSSVGQEKFEYGIEGIPFTSEIADYVAANEFSIKDAKPGQYLVLYAYTHTNVGDSDEKYTITQYGKYKLTQALLKYPCTLTGIVDSGLGKISLDSDTPAQSFVKTIAYNTNVFLKLTPETGYEISSVKQNISGTLTELYNSSTYNASTGIQITPTSDMTIEVTFVKSS